MRAHPTSINWTSASKDDPTLSTNGARRRSAAAPLKLRLRVLMTRRKLDREILGGYPLGSPDALALRVQQLTSESARHRIARDLRGVVEYVDRRGPRPLITAVMIEPAAVRAGRSAILDLAVTLERSSAVRPRGIVLVHRLLTDGTSPLFNRASHRTVTEAVWEIQDALDGNSAHAYTHTN